MADEPTTPPTDDDDAAAAAEVKPEDDQRVPYERFQKANQKAKEAVERAAKLEKDIADLRELVEERENAGLPELEQTKKRLEQAEKRAEENERKAQEADATLQRTRKERWVTAAAQEQNFADPSDASAFVDLDAIDDEKDAERAVKQVARKKAHLIKAEEPTLPGRVLKDGQPVAPDADHSNINLSAEAEMLAEGLKQFASKE